MGESGLFVFFGNYCSLKLNELMKLNEDQRSTSFFELGQRSFRFQN